MDQVNRYGSHTGAEGSTQQQAQAPVAMPGAPNNATAAAATQQVRQAVVANGACCRPDEERAHTFTAPNGNPQAISQSTAPALTATRSAEAAGAPTHAYAHESRSGSGKRQTSNRMFCDSQKTMQELCASLRQGQCQADALVLTGYAASDLEMQQLAEALCAGENHVSEIDFRGTLRKGIIESLADLLQRNARLRSLKIDAQQLSEEMQPWQALATTLARNQTLESLEITFKAVQHDWEKDGRELLYGAISTNQGLRTIEFAEAAMDLAASSMLAQSLRANPRLTNLRFYRCTFRDGVRHTPFMKALGTHPGLVNLSLGALPNHDDAAVLAKDLETNATLECLCLSNFPRDERTTAFAQAMHDMLVRNHTLQDLELKQHRMNDANIATIAEALRRNRGLTRLRLAPEYTAPNAELTETSVHALMHMLDDNRTIQEIHTNFFALHTDGRWRIDCLQDVARGRYPYGEHPCQTQLAEKLKANRAAQ